MDAPLFRMACPPATLIEAPPDWPAQLLREGNVALLADGGGLDTMNEVAFALGIFTIRVLRREADQATQEATVMGFADALPLLWVAPSFGADARGWAVRRGPMTLLMEADGPLADEERRRIDRFVASLGRQAD